MKPLIVVAILLTGCSAEQMSNYRAAQMEAQVQHYARVNSPEGQAEQSCEDKAQFAMGGYQPRGFGLEGVWRKIELKNACMNHWRRTGMMP